MAYQWLHKLIQPHRQWIPYIVLVGTLGLTALATAYVQDVAEEKDQIRFQNAIQRTEDSIENRLNTYIAMLRGGAGLFSTNEPIEREQFRAYVNRLLLKEYYPGVQGIGFSKRYTAAERDDIPAALQLTEQRQFALKPDFDRSVYYPIIYLEPLDRRNQRAVGYDMFTEPTRRAAMQKARDLGLPAASGKVTLVQEIDEQKQAGFLIYVPVYEGGKIPDTVAARRDQLEGFVYSPFRADDLMAGIFGAEPFPFLSFQIYDGTTPTPKALLYSSRLDDRLVEPGYQPRFTETMRVAIAGHPWTIVYATQPAFDATSSIALVPYVAAGGTVISFVLFGITRSQVQARIGAEKIAANLRRSEYNLQRAYDEMELRVEERTAELSSANTVLEEQIIARQRVQEALEQQTDTLQEQARLLDLAHDSIIVRSMDNTILFWNEGAVKQYGWSKAEAIGQQSHQLLQTQFPAACADIERDLLQQNFWTGELVHTTRAGTPTIVASRWALQRDAAGQPISILEIDNDITDQKQAEQSLHQALAFESLLKRITEQVRDSLDETQILQTAVDALANGLDAIACNTGVYDLEQGISTIAAESTHHQSSVLGHVVRMDDFPAGYTALLAGQNLQFCLLRYVLTQERIAVLASPIFDDQGILGDIWLFRPPGESFSTFEVRLLEQVATQCAIALRQARLYETSQAQVKALEKVNWLKDDFLSTVSHELRTPVSNMKMAIHMLDLASGRSESLNGNRPRVQQYLQILQSECQREIDLINDLLDLQRLISGRQTLNIQTVDLPSWLTQIIQPFEERAQARQQTLQLEPLDPNLPPLVADIPSLERILSELINNACKYTPPHERISVKVRSQHDRLQFSVCNTGVEIPQQELPLIFDKFYRVPNADPWKQGGTGLGLALAQRLAEHMDGQIQVKSAHDMTTFTVEIPILDQRT